MRVPLDIINKEFVEKFKVLCDTHDGEHKLLLQVMDIESEVNVDFSVSTMKVEVGSKLVEGIRALGLSYKLN